MKTGSRQQACTVVMVLALSKWGKGAATLPSSPKTRQKCVCVCVYLCVGHWLLTASLHTVHRARLVTRQVLQRTTKTVVAARSKGSCRHKSYIFTEWLDQDQGFFIIHLTGGPALASLYNQVWSCHFTALQKTEKHLHSGFLTWPYHARFFFFFFGLSSCHSRHKILFIQSNIVLLSEDVIKLLT